MGGGIRNTDSITALEVAFRYFRAGADRVAIGSDAVVAAENFLTTGVLTGLSSVEQISRFVIKLLVAVF